MRSFFFQTVAPFILLLLPPYAYSQQVMQVDSVGQEFNNLTQSLIQTISNSETQRPFSELKKIVVGAYDQSPISKSAFEVLSIEDARLRESDARFLPQVTVTANRVRDSVASSLTGKDYSSQALTVSQFLYDFNSLNLDHKSFEIEKEVSEAEFELRQSDLLLKLISIYYEVYRANLQFEITQKFISSRQQFLSLIKQREEIGGSSRADIVRAEAKLAEALDSLPSALQQKSNATLNFEDLFQFSPDNVGLHQLPAYNLFNLRGDMQRLVDQTLERKQAELKVAALNAKLHSEERKRFGSFSVEGTFSRGDYSSQINRDLSSVSIKYTLNVFSGFAQQQRITQAALRVTSSEFDLEAVKSDQTKRLKAAILNYETLESIVDSRIGLVRQAKDASDVTRELFVLNRGSIADIFKAQEDYIAATRGLLNSYVDRSKAFYELLHVLGDLSQVLTSSN